MKKKMFSQNDNYFDIKNKITESLVSLNTDSNKNFICEGVNAFIKYENRDRIENFAKRVDSLYSATHADCIVPMILYGVIVMYHRSEFANDLSDDALALFSQVNHKNSNYLFEELDYAISCTSPEVLNLICTKTKDVSFRSEYYIVSEEMLSDEDMYQENKTKSSICDKIRNMTDKECVDIQNKYINYDEIAKIAENMNFKM